MPLYISCICHYKAHQPTSSPASHLGWSPQWPCHWLFVSFYSSGTKRTTIIIIHHTTVRVEPGPTTAIQGGGQRPSSSPPTPIVDSSTMTQTPLKGGLLSPVTLPATRRPLLVPHKATGGATTQTRTTNVLPSSTHPPNSKKHNAGRTLYSHSAGPEDLIYPG